MTNESSNPSAELGLAHWMQPSCANTFHLYHRLMRIQILEHIRLSMAGHVVKRWEPVRYTAAVLKGAQVCGIISESFMGHHGQAATQ